MAAGGLDQIPVELNPDPRFVGHMDETVFIDRKIALHGKTVIILGYKVFKVFTVFDCAA